MKEELILKLIDRLIDDKPQATANNSGLDCNEMMNTEVIIRTYSAGVWFGKLDQKAGNEVILLGARRMWQWHTKKSISLSSVAIHGIDDSKSKVCEPVFRVWLEAIEILYCTEDAIRSLRNAEIVESE